MAEGKQILIQTRLGEMNVDQTRIIHFPRGLIGFEDHQHFTLLQIKEDSPFLILQSVNDKDFGLLVTDPYSFLERYEVKIGDPEQRLLQIEDRKHLAVLVTVSIPAGQPEKTTLNLSGPILINTEIRLGLQIPQTDSSHPSNYSLARDENQGG